MVLGLILMLAGAFVLYLTATGRLAALYAASAAAPVAAVSTGGTAAAAS